IALDASGSYWRRYGSARRHVQKLQVVLADGTLAEVGSEPVPVEDTATTSGHGDANRGEAATNGQDNPPATASEVRKRELVGQLRDVLRSQATIIGERRTKALVDRCGYQLTDVLGNTHLDLAKLLCGSEGTLALVTEAVVSTQPLPRHRGVAMLFFD